MAIERKAVRKRISLPRGGHVDIPCLESVPFVVGAEQFQERIMYFKNGPDSYRLGGERTVHVRDVPALNDPSQTIAVERIDKMMIKTMSEQAQERKYLFKNNDPPPITPAGENDPSHEKVRYVRYYMNNDVNSDVWVDVEIIERQKIICPNEQYQEWMLYLKNDPLGDTVDDERVPYGPLTVGFCDDNLPLTTFEGSEIDPPYRFDPFQNIIQFSEELTSPEPFMAVWIRPAPFGSQLDPNINPNSSGMWVGFTSIGNASPSSVFNALGGPIYTGAPHHSDLDMRFVDQFFDPKTYDNTGTGALGTGDVKGYTWTEWIVGFSPPVGWPADPAAPPTGLNGLWFYQLRDYEVAVGNSDGAVYPDRFDFESYGFKGTLRTPFMTWWNIVQAGGSDFPLPVCAVRMTALGPNTTDNPAGRY